MSKPLAPLFATIDLGSNSFYLLIAKCDHHLVDLSKIAIVTKIKRKVRLASGLKNGYLDKAAIDRGLDCLQWFADTLKQIQPNHCAIVATATLRMAKNAADFISQGEAILGRPIRVISGIEEASLIYQGASSSSNSSAKQLVIDIGGASTELALGQNHRPIELASLALGCVTSLEQFFVDKKLNEVNFTKTINAARKQFAPIKSTFLRQNWQQCLGASGTFQAIREIMQAQTRDLVITQKLLLEFKQQMIDCQYLELLNIKGLNEERVPVFPSGIGILIAFFQEFDINAIELAKGALREGLLFNLINLKKLTA